jgi:hypothetical protein
MKKEHRIYTNGFCFKYEENIPEAREPKKKMPLTEDESKLLSELSGKAKKNLLKELREKYK